MYVHMPESESLYRVWISGMQHRLFEKKNRHIHQMAYISFFMKKKT